MNTLQEILDTLKALDYAVDRPFNSLQIFDDNSGNYRDHKMPLPHFHFNLGLEDIRETACNWFFEGYK